MQVSKTTTEWQTLIEEKDNRITLLETKLKNMIEMMPTKNLTVYFKEKYQKQTINLRKWNKTA